MDKRANPFVAPANQNHHVHGLTGYPYRNDEVQTAVRVGYELWPLNMVGTLLVWASRWLCAVMYYHFFTASSATGITFFDQVRYAWATSGPGSGMVKYMMTAYFIIPFIFLVLMAPGALMRTYMFTLPENPPPPRREWWHWLAGK